MSAGSAIFKVIASLVWGVGTTFVISSMRTEGASGGWGDLLLCLGLLGLLQGFSFVSFIMATFNRGAEESANTIEETIWFDRFGREVRRETDAGSGCLFAVILWVIGILLTLLASAVIAPLVFVINLCRAAHRFAPVGVAVILDLLIVGGTICGTAVGYEIADKAIEERAARRQIEAAEFHREAEAKAAAARAEREAENERKRVELEAESARQRAEYEAKEAQRRVEREAKARAREAERLAREQQRNQERAEREAKMQERKAQQQAERARRAAELEEKRARQEAERAMKKNQRQQNRRAPRKGQKMPLPF